MKRMNRPHPRLVLMVLWVLVLFQLHGQVSFLEGNYLTDEGGKVVVVYTGPTELNTGSGKTWLYRTNFEYFLEHGIDCPYQDTILVLTKSVAQHYKGTIEDIQHNKCHSPEAIRVVERKDVCYDMESLRVVFDKFDLSSYDYFVYVNCGLVGPKKTNELLPWTRRYTSLLSDSVKMSGLSINCDGDCHVQSMLFALDRVGLEVIKESGAVYNCGFESNAEMGIYDKIALVDRYEVGMSHAIFQAGYGIQSTHGTSGPYKILPEEVADGKTAKTPTPLDIWIRDKFPITQETSWEDYMFWKSSRMFLLKQIQDEVNYKHVDQFDFIDRKKAQDTSG